MAQAFEEPLPNDIDQNLQEITGLTLIMACRNPKRAAKARDDLLYFFNAHVAQLKRRPDYNGYAEEFQKNVQIDVEYLDLASIKTVLDFARIVSSKCVHLPPRKHICS